MMDDDDAGIQFFDLKVVELKIIIIDNLAV